jgi:hypothetical protein
MHWWFRPQPPLPGAAHTLVPPAAAQLTGDLHAMTVVDRGVGVLAQQTSPAAQSAALRQQLEMAEHVPWVVHVGIVGFA